MGYSHGPGSLAGEAIGGTNTDGFFVRSTYPKRGAHLPKTGADSTSNGGLS